MIVRLSVSVRDIADVLAAYSHIKLFKSTTETGTYAEVLPARVELNIGTSLYWLVDVEGSSTNWYKTAYFNESTSAESDKSNAVLGNSSIEKIGFSFNNYHPVDGEWGEVLTPDDIRYTYLFGLSTTAQDMSNGSLSDEQILYWIRNAVSDFERILTIDIRRRKYVTQPTANLIRAEKWRAGIDYTDTDDMYDFDPQSWGSFGFLQLRHYPVLSVQKAHLRAVTGGVVMDLLAQEWVRVNNKVGQINFFPSGGIAYGPFAVGGNIWRINLGSQYPQGFVVDYETGFESCMYVPDDLKGVIGKWAAANILAILGDAHYPGISSQSLSLDGLSESKSLTKSAQSGLYGGRIKTYTDEVSAWLKRNRYKYSIPIGFIGAR